jgi:hypothetical protein
MRVIVGTDANGDSARAVVRGVLEERGVEVEDVSDETKGVDHPDVADRVARAVAAGDADRGILVCEDIPRPPLVCVGEQHPATPAQAADEVEAQLVTALEAAGSSSVLVAYQPCRAIGVAEAAASDHVAAPWSGFAGQPASPPCSTAAACRPSRSKRLMQAPIDGVFVGRAATTVAGFVEIARRGVRAWPGVSRAAAPR